MARRPDSTPTPASKQLTTRQWLDQLVYPVCKAGGHQPLLDALGETEARFVADLIRLYLKSRKRYDDGYFPYPFRALRLFRWEPSEQERLLADLTHFAHNPILYIALRGERLTPHVMICFSTLKFLADNVTY